MTATDDKISRDDIEAKFRELKGDVDDNVESAKATAATVGAFVAAGPEGFVKSAYRHFTIKGEIAPGDDYAMMREVLSRRFARALKEDPERAGEGWPDLVLIDGGQGQLAAAISVMEELGIEELPLVAIAKGPDRDAGRERFFMAGREPFQLEPRDHAAMNLVGPVGDAQSAGHAHEPRQLRVGAALAAVDLDGGVDHHL